MRDVCPAVGGRRRGSLDHWEKRAPMPTAEGRSSCGLRGRRPSPPMGGGRHGGPSLCDGLNVATRCDSRPNLEWNAGQCGTLKGVGASGHRQGRRGGKDPMPKSEPCRQFVVHRMTVSERNAELGCRPCCATPRKGMAVAADAGAGGGRHGARHWKRVRGLALSHRGFPSTARALRHASLPPCEMSGGSLCTGVATGFAHLVDQSTAMVSVPDSGWTQ
jgi:hypothetical protein